MTDKGCYDTFAEAVSVATRGNVQLDSSITPAELTQELLDSQGMQSSFGGGIIIGVDYDDDEFADWLGAHIWEAAQDCGPASYGANTMPSNWNDRVGSSKSFSDCDQNNHFENTFMGGGFITCNQGNNCQFMGPLDNKTSSENWLD